MSKTFKELAITSVLIIVLVVVVINNLKGRSRKRPKGRQESSGVSGVLSPSSVNVPADKGIIRAQKERAESLVWGRDPFQYIETKTDRSYRTESLILKGISLGRDKPAFAFINSEIVKTGDIIGGYEVIRIQRDRVLLKKGSRVFYLTLPEE
jgi:hypothetical protein